MSEEALVKRGRGRPPGSIRDVFYTIAATKNGAAFQEKIKITRGENISEEDMRNEARATFFNQFDVDAECIEGPFFDAKLSQTSTNKRESIRIDEENINYTKRKANAVYGDWFVFARYIEDEDGSERDDIVRISFKKEINPGAKPKAPPKATFKLISELTDIVEVV